jgi:hypothetical protein
LLLLLLLLESACLERLLLGGASLEGLLLGRGLLEPLGLLAWVAGELRLLLGREALLLTGEAGELWLHGRAAVARGLGTKRALLLLLEGLLLAILGLGRVAGAVAAP